MRVRTNFASALFFALSLVLFGVLPAAAWGQFQEPTKEELSMTSDPKAPGAAAVFLYFEEKTDDDLHYHSVKARIKVLTEKGKALATVNVPYVRGETKITDIRARTIHADGTVIPLEGKPEDLLQSKTGERQIGRRVFNLPSVEVGSILEYQYDIRYDDNVESSPYWEIQKPYYVHKAHYYFVPFKGFQKGANSVTSHYLVNKRGDVLNSLLYWELLPVGTKVMEDAVGKYTLDLTEIPAAPDEDYMPPIDGFLYQVLFYYTHAYSGGEYWTTEAKRWSKDVDHFAEPSGKIKEAVAGIVAPADSDLEKAKKLYKAVQALDNTDYTRARGRAELKELGLKPAKRAEDTWAQKSGSSQDIALLYLAMLRAAGLTAYDGKVVNRARSLFQPNYLNFDQLDDDVVILSTGGKEVVLDPGEKMCPFELVKWTHQGAGGIRQAVGDKLAFVTPLQPYTVNQVTRVGDVTVDASGTMEGNFRILMMGQEALRWRQMALENDVDELKLRFDRMLREIAPEGVQLHVDHFLGLDDEDVNLMVMVKGAGTVGTAAGKRLLLPGFFFESRGGQPFVAQAERKAPVDMHFASRVTDQVTYHFPEGMQVEGAPQSTSIPWAPRAQLATKITPGTGQIVVTRQFTRGFTFLGSEQYQELRGFAQKTAANDQQQVVVTGAK